MIREHKSHHRFGHGHKPRKQARIVTPRHLDRGRFAFGGDRRLFAGDTAGRLDRGVQDDRHARRDAAQNTAVTIGSGHDPARSIGLERVVVLTTPLGHRVESAALGHADDRRKAEQSLTQVGLELVEDRFAEARGYAAGDDDRPAADAVEVFTHLIDEGRHALGRRRVGAASGIRFPVGSKLDLLESDQGRVGHIRDDGSDLRDVGQHFDPAAFAQNLFGDRPRGHASRRFSRAAATAAAIVAPSVLGREPEVGVPRPKHVLEMAIVFGPRVAIADEDSDRRTGGSAFEDPTQNLWLVGLSTLAHEVTLPRPASNQIGSKVVDAQGDPRRDPIDDRKLTRSVRFARRRQPEHFAECIARHDVAAYRSGAQAQNTKREPSRQFGSRETDDTQRRFSSGAMHRRVAPLRVVRSAVFLAQFALVALVALVGPLVDESAATAAPGPPPAMSFDGNVVLPNEVYQTVLRLAATATSSVPVGLDEAAAFVEEHLTRFLRDSGYLLATVHAERDPRGGLRVQIDEGRLDRVIVVGQGVVRTLQVQLNLDLPQNVFNRFVLERQLADLVRARDLDEATYEVVPMEKIDHVGIQFEPSNLLLGGSPALQPGSPHELRIRLQQPQWRTGFGQGIGFQSPDGFHISGSYRDSAIFLDDDRWFSELQIAFRSFEALFSSNDRVGFSRLQSINRWYGAALMNGYVRPSIEIDLQLQSRFRGDLMIDQYRFAPLSASLDASIEPWRGLEVVAGGGIQYRSLFNVEPESDVVLEVRTEERTIRAFLEAEAIWSFEPDLLRQDRQDTLHLAATYFSGSSDNFNSFARFLARYDQNFLIGYDELWFEIDGALLVGDVPFYDEVALGDGFVRLGYSGEFFTRKAASITAEYRLSLSRQFFKVSIFNDAAIFEQLQANRNSEMIQFTDTVGMGLHFLVLNTFQVNFYVGVGFVPELAPKPGVSLQVKQAF